MTFRAISAAASLLLIAGCATFTPQRRIETGLVELGVAPGRAHCLAGEVSDDLGRRDLNALADFLDGLNRENTPGGAVDALLRIDSPHIAAAIAAAAVSCALSR